MKHTKEDLRIMQAWSLQRKIQVTQTRIMEWHHHFGGQVYISFSGGKDSTVLLDLARRIYPDIEAVFVDTGLEYPEIRQFVKTFDNVTWLRPARRFDEVIEQFGYPVISKEVSQSIYEARKPNNYKVKQKFDKNSEYVKKYGERYCLEKWNFLKDSDIPVSHKCCNEMKKKPFKKYEKLTGKNPIVGTLAAESQLRKSEWLKSGCNSFDGKRPMCKPISFWTTQDILHYLKITEIPYCNIYGDIASADPQITIFDDVEKLKTTGAEMTGCMFCMFGIHSDKEPNRFQRMKETHPKQYDYCINNLGCGKVLDYIGVPY